MIANIEQEYNNYVCNIWQEISDVTKDSLELHREREDMYNIISLASNQFLQDRLKTLGTEKS